MNLTANVELESLVAEILERSSFFACLNGQQLKRIAGMCHLREYRTSSAIYRLGDPADELFVLCSGTIRFTIGGGQREASAGELSGCGEVFGWTSLVETADARFATALCITPCTALALSGGSLLKMMNEDRDMGYLLMKQLTILISSTLTTFAAG